MGIPQKREEHYKLKVLGKSGVFDMGNDIHVEYLQTSLSIEQIREISSVRKEFKRGELPFDLMMQREVDDERIKNELIPYLIENELSFFPPITIVILEVDKYQEYNIPIKKLYPALSLDNNYEEDGYKYEKRKFGNLFTVKILKDNDEKQRWYTELTVGSSATLLAVDGQHRLIAFQAILDELTESEKIIYENLDESIINIMKSKDFSNLTIPVTFIFVPQLEENNTQDISLVEAFRKIFVDINRNARKVNEMRNVLLDEQDLRSIFTRKVCGKIQEGNLGFDSISIDEIEWEKTTKENQLTNPLALTNILFLRDMFNNWVGRQKKDGSTAIKIAMNLERYSKDLEISEEYNFETFDVEHFSYKQKNFVVTLFENDYVTSFVKLINSLPCALERHKIVNDIKEEVNQKNQDAKTAIEIEIASKIKEILFDGEEKRVYLKEKYVKVIYDELLNPLISYQNANALDIVRTRVFQEAYFNITFRIYNKGLLEYRDFSEFCNFMYENVSSEEYIDIWKQLFINNKLLLEKALKGRSGYSRSTTLLESFESLIFLFITKVFRNQGIDFQKSIDTYRSDSKKVFIENSLFKYKKDVEKTSSGEEETDTKVDIFKKELISLMKILD